jgi:betaine-homocysteine S-methyltransferase
MKTGILDRLKEGVVLGDGGYIIELERRGYVIAGPFTPEVAIRHPEAIRQLHQEFLNADVDVLQVMAFYGSREKLATVGQADKAFEINRAATRIALEVAGDQALVAGDLSATWKWQAGDTASREMVAGMFDEQIEAQEGVDFFIGETFWHLGEARLCLERIKAKSGVPAMITMAFRGSNSTDDGFTASDCARILSDEGAEIVGANCMRDPERMYPILEEMRKATKAYLAAQPVAFRCTDEVPWFTANPAFPDKLEQIMMTRYEMGKFATRARDLGVEYIGSCCGSIATHVREMAKALGKYKEQPVWQARPDSPMSETEFNWERRQAGV